MKALDLCSQTFEKQFAHDRENPLQQMSSSFSASNWSGEESGCEFQKGRLLFTIQRTFFPPLTLSHKRQWISHHWEGPGGGYRTAHKGCTMVAVLSPSARLGLPALEVLCISRFFPEERVHSPLQILSRTSHSTWHIPLQKDGDELSWSSLCSACIRHCWLLDQWVGMQNWIGGAVSVPVRGKLESDAPR